MFPGKNGLALIAAVMAVSSCVEAAPGDGIKIGSLVINPFVEGNYTTDSNVELNPENEIEDSFLEGIGGVQFHVRRDSYVLEGRVFSQVRRYDKFDNKDFDDWGESLNFYMGSRDTLSIAIDQNWRQVSDYDRSTYFAGTLKPEAQNLSLTYDKSTRVERNLHDVGVVFGRRMSDIFELDIGIGASWQDYETNLLFDVENITVKGEIGFKMTDKMSLIIDGEMTEEKNESFDGKARSIAVHAGLKRQATDKLQFRLGVGVNEFNRPEEINDYGREVQGLTGRARAVSEEPRNDELEFSFDLSGTWLATDKITLEIAGHSAIQTAPQYPNTLDYITVSSMSAVYDFSDTVTVSLTGSFRRDDYLDPVVELGEEAIRLDERVAGLARIDYMPPRQFLTLFVEGGYEQAESTIRRYNYDQMRLSGGLSLRY